jgi:putative MATE family efflux protein
MSDTQNNDFLATAKLGKLMCRYSIPCVVSLVVAALYNIVDQIFIANADYLGSYGNAANSVVYPLTVVAMALTMMLGDGCCTFVSISLGAKEHDKAKYGVGNAVVCIVGTGIVLTAIYLIFQEPILTLFGARVNEETFQLSKEYFFWISLGIPFYMFGQAMNPIVRSDGSPGFSMAVLLIGAVINIVLDPIFIFVYRWGMRGAALATILGQIVSALMFVGYLFKMKTVKLDRDSFKLRPSVMKKIIPYGLTSFLSQFSIVLSMAAVLNMVAKYGALDPIFGQAQYAHIPTAVVGIVMKFFQIVVSIAVGISAGCISVAGYNLGAKKFDRVRRLMALLLVVEAIVGAIATAIFLLFPHQLTNIFGGRSESVYYVDFAVKCIRIFLCMVILTCVNKGTFIFMQSLGDAKVSTALSMMREVLFGVGLPLLLPLFFGLDGVLYFMPLADILTFVASLLVVARTNKKLRLAQAQQTTDEQKPGTAPGYGLCPDANG